MNDNEKQFEDFVSDIKFDDTPDPQHRHKLEQNLLRAMLKRPRRIKIWRIIMKSQITKLTAAAVIAIVVLGGISFWPGGNSENGQWWLGSSAVWGREIMNSLEKIEALVYRQRSASVRDFGPLQMSRGWEKRYNAKDRYRRDRYDDGKNIMNIQWVMPDGKDLIMVEVSLEYKCYFKRRNEAYGFIPSPLEEMRRYVELLDRADRILGTKEFNGQKCIGFEINASKYGDNPQGRFDRIWFDLKTKLPVRIERHGLRSSFDAGRSLTIIHDQFEYYAKVPVDLFEPKIPEGFINAHPDEIRAAKERQRKEPVAGTLSETGKQSGESVSTVESAKVDIAIDHKNLTVTRQPDGSFLAIIELHNKHSVPIPRFRVDFYAGDPDQGGRLLEPHGAGPIMPDDVWREGAPGLELESGERSISVVVDPDNKVDESDETNNKASKVIPDRQTTHRTESSQVDIAIGDKDLRVTKLSDLLFEAMIPIRNRGPVPLPRFKVYFYAGDPDKGGRLLSAQNAGPIKPGGIWVEGTRPHRLRPGEDTISVVLDPDNRVEESNETNNKASQTLSKIISESEKVNKVGAIRRLNLSGDDILLVEAQASGNFNFPYYLFIPGGIDKHRSVYILVEPNNSGMVSDDPEVHQAKALTLVKSSHANKMARQLGVPLLIPTFPRPMPHTHSWAYTHALDIDTLELLTGKLKRIDLQLTAMIKHAQELLRTNGFKINDKVFMHGFSASAKFCNRYSYLHPEMVKAAAAGGVNGLPTLPVREWNGYELPFPIGLAGMERFASKPFDEKAFMQVAHFIYMGSSDRNDTLHPREASGPFEAWRAEEAAIIRKALLAEKMMPDRWELSRKIYRQQKLNAQLVTYNGVGHSIQSQMLDDVIGFFKANAGEKYVPIEPYEYPSVDPDNITRKPDEIKADN